MTDRLRVGIIGTGKRVDYLYCPLVRMLKGDLELVGVWGRRLEAARAIGEKHAIPYYDDMAIMVKEARPDLLIVSVTRLANGPVGRRAAEFGLPLLLETPIAEELADADAIIATSQAKGFPIEVAEQYYRRPMERIKGELLRAGFFGRVNTAYNDCMGHAYHGISLIRSYIGFEVPAVRVSAVRPAFAVRSHPSSLSDKPNERERWEHGVIEFANGALGIFDWTSIGYGSAIRWQRSTRFFAEAGMAVGDELTLLSPDGRHRQPIRLERRIHNVGGMETLAEVVAHTDPQVYWRNPFSAYYMDDEMIAEASCLMSLANAIRTGQAPEYGPLNARADQEIYVAMLRSAEEGGVPVDLPLAPLPRFAAGQPGTV